MLGILGGDDLRDAGLIASAQKLEHYKIAAYGTAALAGQLDLRDEQKMLHRSLDEEREFDVLLTRIAKREVNPDAIGCLTNRIDRAGDDRRDRWESLVCCSELRRLLRNW